MDKHKPVFETQNSKQMFNKREENKCTDMYNNNNKQYGSIREYAQDLNTWLYHYRAWNAACSFSSMLPYYFPPTYRPTQTFPFSTASGTPTNSSFHSHSDSQASQNATRRNANRNINETRPQNQSQVGTEYILPPLWKRVLAEAIDFLVLFYMKVMLTIVVLRHMGYLRNENPLDLQLDLGPMFDITEMDIEKAFNVTSEIIALEIVNRIMITIFETLCLRKGFGVSYGGSTPGKRLLGMKVVSCEQVIDLRNGKVLVMPARDIGFVSALVRSVIKNFTLAFFFPACLTVFFFDHNRAAYDVLAKTIVVHSQERRNR